MKKSADDVLSENLRLEMSRRHLADTDIAHRSGLSVSSVKALLAAQQEGGESASLARVQRVADALGVSTAHLLREADTPAHAVTRRAATRAPSDALPQQLGLLIEEFFILPEADRRALLASASDMASKYRNQLIR